MSWKDQLNDDSPAWLLEPDAPGVRYLALRDLLDSSEDDAALRNAREAAHKEGPIGAILDAMDEAGFWAEPGPGYYPKYRSTVWSIIMLAQLGASVELDERLARACAYLLDAYDSVLCGAPVSCFEYVEADDGVVVESSPPADSVVAEVVAVEGCAVEACVEADV